MKLPGGGNPVVDERKIVDYLLSPNHPVGRHKAKVFSSALGLTAEGAFLLATALRQAAGTGEAVVTAQDSYGARCRIDFVMTLGDKSATIRSAWLAPTAGGSPIFLMAFVL